MNLTLDVKYKYQTVVTGNIYGSLSVVSPPTNDRNRTVECKCICGVLRAVPSRCLLNGRTRSCGKSPCRKMTKWSHGKCKTRIYSIWCAVKARCNNEKSDSYPNYGGRGITICDRWTESFENFLEDMGEPPTDEHSIDRIDVNGNYEPSNCRWVTNGMQNFNQRVSSENTSGKTGISWDKRLNKWHTYINYEKRRVNLGRFQDFEVAITQRLVAELKYYGEFSGD